jgi:hypothetical protein
MMVMVMMMMMMILMMMMMVVVVVNGPTRCCCQNRPTKPPSVSPTISPTAPEFTPVVNVGLTLAAMPNAQLTEVLAAIQQSVTGVVSPTQEPTRAATPRNATARRSIAWLR